VNPSRLEGTPNTVLEAAALGVPVLLSSIEAHHQLFDDQSALFTDVDDEARFAESIESAIAAAIGEPGSAARAQRAVQSFTVAVRAQQYAALYEKVVNGQFRTVS
jgi:glycosyltransferase involved in cell wall biosynthesis